MTWILKGVLFKNPGFLWEQLRMLTEQAATGKVAGSGKPILIPEGPWNGVQEGYLGSETPKLIPQGHRKGRAGSGLPIVLPEGPWNGVQEVYLGSETPKMIP